MNDKKANLKLSEGEEVVAQYICGSTRDCCDNNPYCSRKVAFNSKGDKILDVCSLCREA